MNNKWTIPAFFLLLFILSINTTCRDKDVPQAGQQENKESSLAKPDDYYSDLSKRNYTNSNMPKTNSPLVMINENEEILQVINYNLDLDFDDEQILILKMVNDVNTPLKLAIIDYDSVRDRYFRSCEYLTNSTNQRAFNLEFEDIIGDYTQEIIFTGTTKDGDSTFYAFKKFPSPSNLGLFFSPICHLVSDGTIRIMREDRATTYELNQKPGKSFPIILERRDPSSENSLDIIRETYGWNFSESSYEIISSVKIPGKVVEENQLRALYFDSTLEDYNAFLEGPWYNTENIKNMIVFVPDMEQIIFYSSDIQEIYHWDYRQKTLYNSLMFIVQNPTSQSPRRRVNITVKSIDTINISIGDINWDGQYTKVNNNFIESLLNKKTPPVSPANLGLNGWYEDEIEGVKIIFEPPRFTMITTERKEVNGGFSVIHNIPIINDYYLNKRLRKIPVQLSKEGFEKEVLAQLNSYTAKKTLENYYNYDRNTGNYLLRTELTEKDQTVIWDILLTIQYKGYKKYQLGVLTLNILDENRLISTNQNYILEYAEVHDATRIIRSLVLTPGKLGVTGIEAVSDESWFLVQTEYLE